MGLLTQLFRLLTGQRKPRHVYRAPPPSAQYVAQVETRPSPSDTPRRSPGDLALPRQTALVGRCWVIDGDTIDIGGTRIRLAGIDAPELDHPYGKNAKSALLRLCQGNQIRAVFDGALSHDRAVATCFLPDGRDLSAEMVKLGMAIDWPKFSQGKYRHLEPVDIRKKLWRCDARQKGRMPASMPD